MTHITATGAVDQFLTDMSSAGLEFDGEIIGDGELHRIKVNGDRNANGWYVLHLDGDQALIDLVEGR